MTLRNKHLQYIYQAYLLEKGRPASGKCPSPHEIMTALRAPTKRTRKVVDHIVDCSQCYQAFAFLKEVAQHESSLIEAIEQTLRKEQLSESIKEKFFSLFPLRKILPYSVAVVAAIFLILFIYRNTHLPPDAATRSTSPVFLSLSASSSNEESDISLEWAPVPYAHAYSFYIFDSGLNNVWSGTTEENRCLLPPHVSVLVKKEQWLLLCIEALAENGTVIQGWMGKMPELKRHSERKSGKKNLR